MLRLGLFLCIQPWQEAVRSGEIIVDDAVCYHRLAVNLLEEGVYSNADAPPFARHMYRTPVYPFFLTAVYVVFGIKAYMAILLQLLISAAICVITYRLGLMLFGAPAALAGALLLAADYSHIFYANQLLSETLFTFLFLVHIYWFCRFLLFQRRRDLVYAGFFLGFSVLCRPVALYYIVIAVAILMLWLRKTGRVSLMHSVIITGAFLLSLLPWVVRNYALSGGGVFVSEQQSIALSWYTGSIEERLQKSGISVARQGQRQERGEEDYSSGPGKTRLLTALARESLEYVEKVGLFFVMPAGGENAYARLLHVEQQQWDRDDFIEKPRQLVSDAVKSMPGKQWAVILFTTGWMLFVNIAVLTGIRYGWRGEERLFVQVLLAIIFYFALATGAAFAARFRVPVLPYMMLLAGLGLSRKEHRRTGTGSNGLAV